ncbi:PLCG1 [Mytilus edulis]|uniref:PLCG1 n=1 Tax=Mytilus edulis TaxID=6550 RepID=A0A8S3RDP6_MYTED|nr:PLCG1 [Mytilus edulis]
MNKSEKHGTVTNITNKDENYINLPEQIDSNAVLMINNRREVRRKCNSRWQHNLVRCKEKIHPRLKSSEKHRIVSIQDIWKNKEPWNYGKMTRVEADTLLKKYKHMGDGAFLVRESRTLTGNYILSILIKDETVHLRIHTKEESGQLKYDFNGNLFDSLDNYIEFLKHGTHIFVFGVSDKAISLTKHLPKS